DENLRSRKTAAIDDRGVIQLVGNDEIVFAQKCRNRPRVRRESRLEHHASFDVLETRDLLFQLHVNLHRARDGAHHSRPEAILARGFKRRFAQLRMRSEPKVIVRGKVNDSLAVESADRRLLVLQHAQLEVRALGLEFLESVLISCRDAACRVSAAPENSTARNQSYSAV